MPTKSEHQKSTRAIHEARSGNPELNLAERGWTSIEEIPSIWTLTHLRRLCLSGNNIRVIPPQISDLVNLEWLNLSNNAIQEVTSTLSTLPRLRILKLGFNRIWNLPSGFGTFPCLEILDLTYNNLSEKTGGSIFMIQSLRALLLGDNDFTMLPPEIRQLNNLQVLVLRDNDILTLPKELEALKQLRELNVQGNQLTALPPEIGNLAELAGSRALVRLENNPWLQAIQEQLAVGVPGVFDLLRSAQYQSLYAQHTATAPSIQARPMDKSRKASRRND